MKNLTNIKVTWVIHLFAALHAIVAFGCRFSGLEDELLLTLLTMTMALIVCLKRGLNIEFTAASIIVVNIMGYILGNLGARIFQTIISSQEIVHAVSTFLTTEILGWSIFALTKIFSTRKNSSQNLTDKPYLSWLILAMCGIFILRLGIIFILSSDYFSEHMALETSGAVFSNSFSLITLICINVLYIRYTRRLKDMGIAVRSLTLVAFMLVASLLETFLVGLAQSFDLSEDLIMLFAASLLAQITVYCAMFMVNYSITARIEMKEEREKANMAQYRYIKLKHQVNPHFLFNSLNILDCLICEEETERASTYTHKLAGIYRYMIRSEDEMVLPLRDEMVFAQLYIDLLKERFPSGFEIRTDVPEECMGKYVLSCSVQLLIENATKHNTVSPEKPLIIDIKATEDYIRVTNNIVPKVTKAVSTGLGEKYIRQMYLDITGKQIEIVKTEESYSVTLPLI